MFLTACLDFIYSLFNRRFIINIPNPDYSGQDLEKIVNFIYDNGGEYYNSIPSENLYKVIRKHLECGTFLRLDDPKGIVAVGRGNWTDETTALVLDCVIRNDYRSVRTLKYLIDIFVKKNPRCKKILYQRNIRGDNKIRELNIKENNEQS